MELVDELADGARSAALPLIRRGLALSYGQVGLLAAVPIVLGSLLELPLGVLAGQGRRRRLFVLAGGVVFILSLAAAAVARSFAALLVAFVIFFPASGAFAGLTQSGLMDADPGRRERNMALWDLAGSAGALIGPVLMIAVLAAGGGWRPAYLVLAGAAAAAWLGVAGCGPRPGPPEAPAPPRVASAPQGRPVIRVLLTAGVLRWLLLLQVCDLQLDILTGFLAVYLVDVVHATPAQAALGVAVRLGAGLAGDAVLVRALHRTSGLSLLRASAAAAAGLYPAFLLVPGMWPKLVLLACLSVATAPWYPLLQAQLYASLPGRSGVAVSLSSAASLVGGAAPLLIGFLAERFGLAWALSALVIAPPAVLAGVWRRTADGGAGRGAPGQP